MGFIFSNSIPIDKVYFSFPSSGALDEVHCDFANGSGNFGRDYYISHDMGGDTFKT